MTGLDFHLYWKVESRSVDRRFAPSVRLRPIYERSPLVTREHSGPLGKGSGMKAPHHRGTHQRRAKALTDRANADPTTRCWRCGRTLAQHPLTRKGKLQHWTAGHLVDGDVDGVLLPEASGCNYAAGARLTNTRRGKTNLTW